MHDIGRQSWERLDGDTRAVLHGAYGQSRMFLERLSDQALEVWTQMGSSEQMVLVGSTLLGAAGGLLLGLVAPRRSSRFVSALAGSAVCLGSAVWLAHALQVPGREILHRSPMGWVVIWIAVASVGVLLQIRTGSRVTADE